MNSKNKLRVGVIMGGPSTEHEVSLESGTTMVDFLDKAKYLVRPIIISTDNLWCVEQTFMESDGFSPQDQIAIAKDPSDDSASALSFGDVLEQVLKTEIDFALIAMHGPFGEDGALQGILDYIKVPYNGSGIMASALAMDKIMCKTIYIQNGLPTPGHGIIKPENWAENRASVMADTAKQFSYPVVLKIARSGSSYGVDIPVEPAGFEKTMDLFMQEGDPVLVEQYVKGREFSCGVLETTDGKDKQALPIVEIRPKKALFFDTTAKYDSSASEEIIPAEIDAEMAGEIEKIALKAHEILRCNTYSRTDVLLSEVDNNLYAIETNTLPGFAGNSLFPKEAKAAGISGPELLDRVIQASMNT
jgi:D-alanine-D-alanine ligase